MSDSQYSVRGQTAIVTGASRGIGRGIAERFVSEGADVVICSREQEAVDAVAEEINQEHRGQPVEAVECDVTDRSQVDTMVAAAVDRFDGLDVLVNNAGASFMAPFEELSENGWHRILEINLTGTFHCTQAAYERMHPDGGSVVNVSSVAALDGSPQMAHYGAAKAGMINLTRTLAYELAEDDIRVNCIAPGIVATEGMKTQMGFEADEIDRTEVKRRIGTIQEIAEVVQFLVSPAASYVTGQTLTVEGVPQVEETHEFPEPYSWI